MIRLSVIVPFYNVEKYIEQCIRSLYDQDIPQEEYEVICVDDCSPDGSRAIVERLQKEYPTLQLICHTENKRQGGARNTGLKVAKGEYIWFVDSDDYVLPNVMGRLLREAERNELDILHFMYWEDRSGELVYYYPNEQYVSDIMTGVEFFFRGEGTWWLTNVTPWQKLAKRSYLVEHNLLFVEDIMFEDNVYALQLFSHPCRVKHIALQAYVYRANPNSVTREQINYKHVEYWLGNAVAMMDALNGFRDCNAPRFEEAGRQYIQNMIYKVGDALYVSSVIHRWKLLRSVSLLKLLKLKSYCTNRSYLRLFFSV